MNQRWRVDTSAGFICILMQRKPTVKGVYDEQTETNRLHGKTVDYYNTAAASIGFQLGAQVKSQVILFMSNDALKKFRASDGWKAGVDGSVALATLGADGSVDSDTAQKPIIGFIFSNKGLMYNLTFEGTKMSKIKK